MTYDANKLLDMNQDQLDELFRNSPAGNIPDGPAQGTAIVFPGAALTGSTAEAIKLFAWQGKVFDARRAVLENKISPIGVKAIVAEVMQARAGLTARVASFSIIRKRHSSLNWYAMKFAVSPQARISG
jgi:hypothetical protein